MTEEQADQTKRHATGMERPDVPLSAEQVKPVPKRARIFRNVRAMHLQARAHAANGTKEVAQHLKDALDALGRAWHDDAGLD